ncbi:MBG domain-containing protein [Mucilaginibacter sp. UYCu711]|uniref:MBG domain-containing protein n=1 Tax=Mucilaginibacter sp. UYCu711 TaxID=3156339 RepID=UPI003D1A8E07
MRVRFLPLIFGLCFLFGSVQGQSIFVGTVSGTITAYAGTPSASPNIQQFTVSGVGLIGPVTATAPAGFEVSTSPGSGYGPSVTMTVNGAVTAIVYVRTAASATAGFKVDNVVLTSATAITQLVGVVATVNPASSSIITVVGSPGTVTTTYGAPSIPGSFSVAGAGLTGPITVTPPAGFEVSTNNINFSPTLIIPATGTLVSTMVYSRLAGTTNAGPYAGDIVLSSPGAANVNVAIPTSTVNKRLLNITGSYLKTYGGTVANVTLYYNTPGVTFTNPSFQNGNSFNSIDLTFIAGTAATDGAGTYPGAVVMSNLTGRNGYLSSNYTVTYATVNMVITPAPLTITINKVTKPYGAALTTTTGVTTFTPTGLKNGETVGSVTVNYGAGGPANSAAGTYPGSVVASVATGGTFSPANYSITYVAAPLDVTAPPPPVITIVTTPQPVNTVYGTPSPSTNFTISATNLLTGVLVTPPPGFEVSTNNVIFSPTVTVGSVGSIASVPVYIRLAAITNAGPYAGNIVLTSGTNTTNVAMPNSIVSPAPLTLAAIDETKYYGGILTEPASSNRFTITAGGLKNGNTITGVALTYGLGKAATVTIGTYTGSVNIAGVNGADGFLASNYAINYTPANIIIEPRPLTIIANNATKRYGETLTGGPGSIAFMVMGLQNGETVNGATLTYAAGGAAKDNAGSYVGKIEMSNPVGVTFIASNYTITYVPGDLTVNPAPLTITAVDASRNYGEPNPAFKATYTGFVNGDNATVLTKQPTLSTTATIESDGGKYPIMAADAAAVNYTITYVNGELTVKPPVNLVIPNTFTPNYDGINDTWRIPALVSYPNCTVAIFNRYGAIVYNSVGYGTPWDGTVKGRDVPVGVYYYIIDTRVAGIKASGSLTVIR